MFPRPISTFSIVKNTENHENHYFLRQKTTPLFQKITIKSLRIFENTLPNKAAGVKSIFPKKHLQKNTKFFTFFFKILSFFPNFRFRKFRAVRHFSTSKIRWNFINSEKMVTFSRKSHFFFYHFFKKKHRFLSFGREWIRRFLTFFLIPPFFPFFWKIRFFYQKFQFSIFLKNIIPGACKTPPLLNIQKNTENSSKKSQKVHEKNISKTPDFA